MEQHELLCKGCGKILNMRDISILSHGWIEDGKIVCYEEKTLIHRARQIGTSIEYINGLKIPVKIHLN